MCPGARSRGHRHCLALCIALRDLKSRCRHRFACVHILHLEWRGPLRLALMRLCPRGAAFGAHLAIDARGANTPFFSAIPNLSLPERSLLVFIAKTWKSCLDAVGEWFWFSSSCCPLNLPATLGNAETARTRSFLSRSSTRYTPPPSSCRREVSAVSGCHRHAIVKRSQCCNKCVHHNSATL